MSKLFESARINGMELSNRFVRSATWEGMAADDGAVTPKLIETMVALAKGGVGMIITSHAYVRQEGQAGPWQIGVYNDGLIDGLKEMAAAVHENGGKIVMQIAHAGHFAAEQLTGLAPWVASDFEGLAKTPRHEMTVDDILALAVSFAEAARRAKVAGFDGYKSTPPMAICSASSCPLYIIDARMATAASSKTGPGFILACCVRSARPWATISPFWQSSIAATSSRAGWIRPMRSRWAKCWRRPD